MKTSVSCFARFLVIGATMLVSTHRVQATEGHETPFQFVEAGQDVIPLEDRSRRKWDSPIVADMDKDGWMDVILTEHGHRVNLFWNNQGTFSNPDVVMHGDIHGQTVADFNRDGLMDLVLYPGGGGGKNPRQPAAFHMCKRSWEGGEAFAHFERTRGRTVKLVDVDQDGKLELFTTGFALDREPQKSEGANFLYDLHGREFQFVSRLPFSDRLSCKMLLTDYNNDGDIDVINYGGHRMISMQGGEGMTFTESTNAVLGDLAKISDVCSVVEIDYDNDGDFDLFLTRSEHPFFHHSFHNEKCDCFAFFSRFKPMVMDDIQVKGNLKVENLQMAYPHFDVLVGEQKRLLEFEVDRHGHKDFELTPEESKGWPEDREAHGLYIGFLGSEMWRLYSNTRSPTGAVIHNVVSAPETVDASKMPAYLLENREGVFVDVTEKLGITINEQATGSIAADFNNDGWTDLFVIRYGNPAKQNEQILYLNQGGKRFVRAEDHGIISKELGATGMGGEAIDYDRDGDIDLIYCNERGRWHLFTNQSESTGNNYIVVKVGDSPTGAATYLGAELKMKVGDNIYRRIVGQSSAGFGQSANYYLHVGIGKLSQVESAVVTWTNGEYVTIEIDQLNQIYPVGLPIK